MKNITLIFLLFVSLLNASCSVSKPEPAEEFSFHLLSEPLDLDPAHFRGASGSYLFNNLFRALYTYSEQELKPENITSCTWLTPTSLSCTLKNKKWSDGSLITAKNYIKTFHRLFSENTTTYQTEHLLNLINAKKILKKTMPVNTLGVTSTKANELLFQLVKPDSSFLHVLSSPAFGPLYLKNNYDLANASKLVTNGPYKIKSWIKGSYALLSPNKYYDDDWRKRPNVKVYFLENDETALTLFETGKMNFLRRLLTSHLDRYKTHPGLMLKPVLRFDYIGLKNKLLPNKNLRKALSLSLNFSELKKIYQGKGLPGCPGLPKELQHQIHCHSFDLNKAKKILKSVPESIKNKNWVLHYSKMGGKDIKKGMEWIQNQWTKHLGLNINLQAAEQGMYLSVLRGNTIDLFRKGVGVDHPTCLSALKTFSQASGENYIKLQNSEYEKLITQLSNPKLSSKKQAQLCSDGIKILIDSYQWIPLGEIHFAMLNDGKYEGFDINHINRLDLTNLRKK